MFRKAARARKALHLGGYETWRADTYANTLTGFDFGKATRQTHLLIHPDGRMRTLTLTEWERLQGFPDGWTAGIPEHARGAALGDAMNVHLARWFARRLIAVHHAIPMLRKETA